MKLSKPTLALIRLALAEDLGRRGDITTRMFLPGRKPCLAKIVFKEAGVLCGTAVVDAVFRRVAPSARVAWKAREGATLRAGAEAAAVEGPPAILTAERTALNFLQRLSGIATLTRRFVDAVRGTRAAIYDTRKTAPGWRELSKFAVRAGGGRNHRMGLYDMALIKDNHLAALSPGEAAARVKALRMRCPGIPVEIEAACRADVEAALALGADMILLDNMTRAMLAEEIRFIRRRSRKTLIEVSGGVDLEGARSLARLGPDRISVGRITHSAPAIDISLELLARPALR